MYNMLISLLKPLQLLKNVSQNSSLLCEMCVVALPHLNHVFKEYREPFWPCRFSKKQLFEMDSYGERGEQGLADPNKVKIGANLD